MCVGGVVSMSRSVRIRVCVRECVYEREREREREKEREIGCVCESE